MKNYDKMLHMKSVSCEEKGCKETKDAEQIIGREGETASL